MACIYLLSLINHGSHLYLYISSYVVCWSGLLLNPSNDAKDPGIEDKGWKIAATNGSMDPKKPHRNGKSLLKMFASLEDRYDKKERKSLFDMTIQILSFPCRPISPYDSS